jgi:hypothetical protein
MHDSYILQLEIEKINTLTSNGDHRNGEYVETRIFKMRKYF